MVPAAAQTARCTKPRREIASIPPQRSIMSTILFSPGLNGEKKPGNAPAARFVPVMISATPSPVTSAAPTYTPSQPAGAGVLLTASQKVESYA